MDSYKALSAVIHPIHKEARVDAVCCKWAACASRAHAQPRHMVVSKDGCWLTARVRYFIVIKLFVASLK